MLNHSCPYPTIFTLAGRQLIVVNTKYASHNVTYLIPERHMERNTWSENVP